MRESELEQTLWDIIREVAGNEPTYSDEWDDHCIYCNGYERRSDTGFIHEPNCIYLKAKALAEKGILAW